MNRLQRPGSRAELIPGLLAVGVFVFWAADGGGYAATSWYPGSLFLLGLLVVTGIVYRPRFAGLHPAHRLALALFAGFVAWSFLSISWAGVQGVSFDAANRALLYLIVFALFSIVPWRSDSANFAMGAYAIGITGVALASVLDAAAAANPDLSLINARFAEPMGYSNAVAALCAGGFWPATYLASSRDVHWSVRGVFLAASAVLLEVALLPQSRGAIIVFPIAILIYLAVAQKRLRAAFFLLPAGLACWLAAPAVLDVFTVADEGGDLDAAFADARGAIVASAGALLLAGTAIAFADARLRVPARVATAGSRAFAGLLAAAALVVIVVLIGVIGNPVSWAGDRWDDFKGGYDSKGFGTSRLSGDLGSNRYDFWRVAIDDQFLESPIVGDGADNFAVAYVEHRDSDEEPLYPHDLPIQVLAGTGLIGGVLVAGFVIAALAAALAVRRRSPSPAAKGVAVVAVASFAYWWLHGLGDWLWAFPALTAPVFAWLGMAAVVRHPAGPPTDTEPDRAEAVPSTAEGPGDADPSARSGGRFPRVPVAVAGGAVIVFALVSLTLPWIAARDVEIASSTWAADPEAAFERLDRAREINFLSAEPDLTAGAIASRLGDLEQVRLSFGRALERDPDNWFARLQLGAAEALEGRTRAALVELGKGSELNPRNGLMKAVAVRARRSDPMPLGELNRKLLRRVCSVVGNTEDTQFCK